MAIKQIQFPQDTMVIVHDDLESDLGKFRVVAGTSFQGHNGLKSI